HEAAIGALPPGAEMRLVDRHWRAPPVLPRALLEVFLVGPGKRRGVGDDGGSLRPQLRLAREGIGLKRQQLAVRADDLEFVDGARCQRGDEYFPHTRID